MKQFPIEKLVRTTGDLLQEASVAPVAIVEHGKPRFVIMTMERFEALKTWRGSQVAASVEEMPDELGDLFDRSLGDHFRNR